MYAIIKTGGKQYKVAKDDILQVEKLEGKSGDKIEIDTLMVSGKDGAIDMSVKSKVKAQILEQVKDKKIVVYKYKPKKNIRKKQGHRQPHTKIKILSI
ncbi:MAG: 50S ribosomal protein L21 [Clostridiales bacterium]|jgi:large subunit ribosomal protein L21|nr:50S ribosomal protein L21 [Clostridiales bacterium]